MANNPDGLNRTTTNQFLDSSHEQGCYNNNKNKDQSNLVKNGIAERWSMQVHRKKLHVFGWGLDPKISTFPWAPGQCIIGPASVPAKWHLTLLNGLSSVHECDRRQTDRQRNVWNRLHCKKRFSLTTTTILTGSTTTATTLATTNPFLEWRIVTIFHLRTWLHRLWLWTELFQLQWHTTTRPMLMTIFRFLRHRCWCHSRQLYARGQRLHFTGGWGMGSLIRHRTGISHRTRNGCPRRWCLLDLGRHWGMTSMMFLQAGARAWTLVCNGTGAWMMFVLAGARAWSCDVSQWRLFCIRRGAGRLVMLMMMLAWVRRWWRRRPVMRMMFTTAAAVMLVFVTFDLITLNFVLTFTGWLQWTTGTVRVMLVMTFGLPTVVLVTFGHPWSVFVTFGGPWSVVRRVTLVSVGRWWMFAQWRNLGMTGFWLKQKQSLQLHPPTAATTTTVATTTNTAGSNRKNVYFGGFTWAHRHY